MTAISVSRLSKRFGTTQALSGIDLSIGSGEMVCLIGASVRGSRR